MKRIAKYNDLILKLLISGGLFSLIFMRTDLSKLANITNEIHISAWVWAVVFIFLQIIVLSYRWGLLMNVDQKRMPFKTSLRITMASFLANYLLITSVGGIIVRVALSVQYGISFVRSVAATALDRFMTLMAMVVIAALFLPILGDIVNPELYTSGVLLILGSLISVLCLSLLFTVRLNRKTIFANRTIAVCYKYLRNVFTKKEVLANVILSSLVAQMMYFASVYIVMDSLGAEIPLVHFMAVIPLITIIASLPVGYGGWGIREGAFVYGLGLVNIPLETAFMASVQIGLISLFAALLAGIPAFMNSETKFALKDWKARKKAKDHAASEKS